LAHKVGDATTLAYLRTTMTEKRQELMASWADYCAGKAVSADRVPNDGTEDA